MMMAVTWKCTLFVIAFLYHKTDGCDFQFDSNDCIYNATCSGKLSTNLIYQLTSGTASCSNTGRIYYNGNNFYGLRLFVKGLPSSDDFFRQLIFNYNYIVIPQILVLIDMSHNHLIQFQGPLSSMPRLKTLNLSYNDLNTAQLYSKEALNSLEHLDLAHNAIDNIDVDEGQYKFNNLKSLNLSHNLLNVIPGGVFESLSHLETLDLSYNNISVLDHYSFEGVKSFRCLSLSHNMIVDINFSLFRFNNLRELYLNNNKIKNVFARDFDKLSHLTELDLSVNVISDIEKGTFSNMILLRQLLLQHNLLSYIDKTTFISTSNLTVVNLSFNLLKALPKFLFRNQNITYFSIFGNILEGPIDRGTFEGLTLIPELDISHQRVTEINDYAFFGMEAMTRLLLNHNKIHTVSNHSFSTLRNVRQLDLSNNMIISLDFDKQDLISLQILSMTNNLINQIQHEHFHGLNSLHYLDLSNNNISKLEPNSFQSMEAVESFEISHNPLRGILLHNTFEGLHMIPEVDLSGSLLTTIENGSFSGMSQLHDLNISHSTINELQFNSFLNTGTIRLLDLSHNKLDEFNVNSTHLESLTALYLSHNYLLHISNNLFKGMSLLNKIFLDHNLIRDIGAEVFADQTDLRYLDLSFNLNLTFNTLIINSTRNLNTLFLNGVILDNTGFTNVEVKSLSVLEISYSGINNASALQLHSMTYLTNLVLSNNNILQLELGTLNNMSSLRSLDLSFNKISFIQPGSFKDNIFLNSLNLSHNSLSAISYGMLRGLIALNVLDVSFNEIVDLRRETFYDVQNLKVLVADHNKITDASEEFIGINLDLLSIGDNPLPCEKIANWKYKSIINVTALRIDEYNGENIEGITCNIGNYIPDVKTAVDLYPERKSKLDSNVSIPQEKFEGLPVGNKMTTLLKGILEKIEKPDNNHDEYQNQLNNVTSELLGETIKSNLVLERILKAVVGMGSLSLASSQPAIVRSNAADVKVNETNGKDNGTLNKLISDVTEIKRELLYLENILTDVDNKISVSRKLEAPVRSNVPNHEAIDGNTANASIFTEVCVGLILLIIVSGILYVFYKSKFNASSPRSISTRHITESIDNSTL